MISFSIVYNRKHKLTKNGTALIQIKAYLNNKIKFFLLIFTLRPLGVVLSN